jgi:PKD repeat protein
VAVAGKYAYVADADGGLFILRHSGQGVHLTPSSQSGTGEPGATVSYQLTLANYTGAADSYNLTLGDHVWQTTLSTDSLGPLADGESATFTVQVIVPTDAELLSTDTVVVRAASTTDPAVYAAAFLTTEAYVPPPPVANFSFYPSDPSVFDAVQFDNYSWDPGGAGFESTVWNFGDGTTSTDWSPSHQYAADGDYAVQLTVTTYNGRSASTSQAVQVRTHDVAIAKFTVPKAARVGQTRSIVVGISNQRSPERVEVQLYKITTDGQEQFVGSTVQSVPVRPAGRTTDFSYTYTFTADDASAGTVTFKAVAYLVSARDARPADNEKISTPTKVTR